MKSKGRIIVIGNGVSSHIQNIIEISLRADQQIKAVISEISPKLLVGFACYDAKPGLSKDYNKIIKSGKEASDRSLETTEQ